jgi:hypothetical protein
MDDDALHQLSYRFLQCFARMEFALKACGFHNADDNGNSDTAQPNWDRFANSIADCFDPQYSDSLKAACDYILQHPPKKQVIRNGALTWEDKLGTGSDVVNLLVYVRRVRNNLFHGGKFNGRWFEPQRSAELMADSIAMLDYIRDLHPDIMNVHHA